MKNTFHFPFTLVAATLAVEDDLIQDGQRIYCACPNRMDPPTSNTETTAIERIEIVSGAFDMRRASSRGGTIQLNTREPTVGLKGEFNLSIGSFDFRQAGFAIVDGSPHWAGLLSIGLKSEWAPTRNGVDSASLNLYYNTTRHPMSDPLRVSSILGMGSTDCPAYMLDRGWFMPSLAPPSSTWAGVSTCPSAGPS